MKRSTSAATPRASKATSTDHSSTANSLRDRIVDVVRNIDQNEEQIVAVVRGAIGGGLRASGGLVSETAHIIEEIVRGSMAATTEAGTGMLFTAKAVAKGVLLGVSDVGGDLISAALTTARSAIAAAAAAGVSVPTVAWRTVGGLVEAGAEVGANVGQIAGAAARGALEGADSAGRQATDLLQSGFASVTQSIARVFEGADGSAPTTTSEVRVRKPTRPRGPKKPAQKEASGKRPARSSPASAAGLHRDAVKAIKRTASQSLKKRRRTA